MKNILENSRQNSVSLLEQEKKSNLAHSQQVSKLQQTISKFNGDITNLKQVCSSLIDEVKDQTSKHTDPVLPARVNGSKFMVDNPGRKKSALANELENLEKGDEEEGFDFEEVLEEFHEENHLNAGEVVKEQFKKSKIYEIDQSELATKVAKTQPKSVNSLLKDNQIYGLFFEKFENAKTRQNEQKQSQNSAGIYGVFFENLQQQSRPSQMSMSGNNENLNGSQKSIRNLLQSDFSKHGNVEEISNPKINNNGRVSYKPQIFVDQIPPKTTQQKIQNSQKEFNQGIGYHNLVQHPIFEDPHNVLSLKAASLFSNSLLFENELLSIYSKTVKKELESPPSASITLTYSPKYLGLTLSTGHSSANLYSSPNMHNKAFIQDLEQTFNFNSSDLINLSDFPKLKVVLKKIDFSLVQIF